MARPTIQAQLARDIAGFYGDPLSFVLYAFPWGKKGTPLEDFPNGPDQWHKDEFKRMSAHIIENLRRKQRGEPMMPYQSAVASGHGIGKSAMVAWLILYLMSTRPNCRGVVTANTGDQLEGKTWPEMQKWLNMAVNKHWFKCTATKLFCVLNPDGEANWKFDCVTWSEERTEGFAGMHNAASSVVMIFDEASNIPDVIWEVAEGAMTDGEPFWFAFGNPTRNVGRFRECFGKRRHRWHTRHIDSRTVKITNKTQIAQWVEDYGDDSDFVRVRVKGQFPRGSDKQFIPVNLVEEAQARELVPDRGAPLILGVDPARFGDDQTVLRFRKGNDARTIPAIKYRGLDDVEKADFIADAINKYEPDGVCIDAGNGTGTIDILRRRGYKVHEIHFGAKLTGPYYNKRSAMWATMRDWLKVGCIDKDQELADDLIGPEYGFPSQGGDALLLEAKDAMKRRGLSSPDNGDALALTFAIQIARRDSKLSRYGRRRVAVAEGVDAGAWGE